MMERNSDRDKHCHQLNLTGGRQTDFRTSRQLRFHLNLKRVLFATNSKCRSQEGLQQQIESKCCKSALLCFPPGSCIIFINILFSYTASSASVFISSSPPKCSDVVTQGRATFTREVSLGPSQKVSRPFQHCRARQMTLHQSTNGLAMSGPAAARGSDCEGYAGKNCACFCTGFARDTAVPTTHLSSKLKQALLQESSS